MEAELRQQIQQLQERLAFYEGFDALIQDNVTQSRELFRLAQERAAATGSATPLDAGDRDEHVRAELEAIARELASLGGSVEALSRRVTTALGEAGSESQGEEFSPGTRQPHRAAIVVHGVASARSALSLQQFMDTLSHVSHVKAREFAGGVLRLDALLSQPLKAAQFVGWDRAEQIQVLNDRHDVFEFSVEEHQDLARLSG